MTTILIPPFGAIIHDLLRASFGSIKECALAADTSDRTVERWWRGERTPNAAQFLLMALNSDPFSERVQQLHDDLKTRRTETNARLERLRATRARAMADRGRDRIHGGRGMGVDSGRVGAGEVRPALEGDQRRGVRG